MSQSDQRAVTVWQEVSGLRLSSREHPRVLVLHRRLLVAQALATLVAADQDVRSATGSDDLEQAAALAQQADVVILDSGARRRDGSGLLPSLVELPSTPIVLCLGDPQESPVTAMLAGARAWVPVDASPELLLDALKAVSQGHIWLPQHVYGDVVERLVRARSRQAPRRTLTNRQLAVLQGLAEGLSINAIAARLALSPNTVRTHRTRLFAKLGVHSAAAALGLARDEGLLKVDTPAEP